MWSTFASVACLFGVVQLAMVPGRTWHRIGSGFAPEVGESYKGKVRGVVDCAGVCSKMSSTKSYFYYYITRECLCHNDVYTGEETGMQNVSNVWYYEEITDVIDLAEMTELPCPAIASVTTNVFRSGASLFKVRAFLNADQTYDDAQAVCVANDGFLYKATTLVKFHLAQQLMTNCSAYMSKNYFINGNDFDVTEQFVTTDGELIQMPADVWAPGRPNDGGNSCLWVAAHLEYKWDDRTCGIHSSYPTYAFCEIPQ